MLSSLSQVMFLSSVSVSEEIEENAPGPGSLVKRSVSEEERKVD